MNIRKLSTLLGLFLSLFAGATAAQSNGPNRVDKVIYFDFDSFILKPEYENTINAHAQFLIANPNAKVSIEGHSEARGGNEYNLSLGQRRAKAVRVLLFKLNVPYHQTEVVSFGSTKPAALGDDEAAFAKNRRVEFFYR